MDLLMVREKATGRFVYTEQMERRDGETSWEYVRRSVRREGQIRSRFDDDGVEVLVGWGTASVEKFLQAYPEYRAGRTADGEKLEGGTVDR